MDKTESAIKELRDQGFDDKAIADALCDGDALASMGLGDEDQTDIEDAYHALQASNISAQAAALGRLGGKVKSERKAAAVRENGKKGGRPKKSAPSGI